MDKKGKAIINGIASSLLPALLTLLGTLDWLDTLQIRGYIGDAIDVKYWKDVFAILGVISTFFFLTCGMIKHEIEENKHKSRSEKLLAYNKNIFVNALSEYIGKEYCSIDIRIFVPCKSLWWKIKYMFNKNTALYFKIKNINGLADAGMTNNLKFLVSPQADIQGLVGQCYQTRKMVYDDNLKQNNRVKYNLSDYQAGKTNELRFSIVCPVFGESKEVIAIVAFDSKQEITINSEEKFTNAILNYTQQMYEHIPELFKREGGVLK